MPSKYVPNVRIHKNEKSRPTTKSAALVWCSASNREEDNNNNNNNNKGVSKQTRDRRVSPAYAHLTRPSAP